MMAFDKPDHASLTPILLSGLSNHERALPDDLNFNPGHEKQLGDRIAALGDEPADQMAERLRKNIGGIRAIDGPRSEAPAAFYNSDEQWRLENEKLFGRTWLLAARAEDVAKRNSYIVWERLGESVVVARDADGRLQAFYNVCQHRAARIVKRSGAAPNGKLICPFHAFTYDLAGRVTHVPQRDCFDEAQLLGLAAPAVAVAEFAGFVWINLAGPEDAEPLEDYLGQIGIELAGYDFDSWVSHDFGEWIAEANWKSLLDGFLESWHTHWIHRGTVKGGLGVDDTVFRILGRHSLMVLPVKAIPNPMTPEFDYRRHSLSHFLLFPFTWFNSFPDHAQVFNIFPISKERTIFQAWSISRSTPPQGRTQKEWQDYMRSAWVQIAEVVGEDLSITHEVGKTAHSRGFRRNIFGGQEMRIKAFHKSVREYTEE